MHWTLARICQLSFALMASSFAAQADPIFIISDLSGSIEVWDTWTGQWRQPKEQDPINRGSLVVIGESSQLTIHMRDRRSPQKSLQILKLKTRGSFRIDESLFRRIDYSQYPIKIIPESPEEEKEAPGRSYLKFAVAWSRALVESVINYPLSEVFNNMSSAPEEGNIQTASAVGKIKWIAPEESHQYLKDRMPATIRLEWRAVRADTKYRVHVWEEGTFGGEPIGVTNSVFFDFVVNQPGQYRAQISTEDHSHRSEVLKFGVGPFSSFKSALGKGPSQGLYLRSAFPADQTVLMGSLPIQQSFVWEYLSPSNLVTKLCLVSKIGTPPTCADVESAKQSYTLNFKRAGDYYWYLEQAKGKDQKWRSAVRKLTVKSKIEPSIDLAKLLSKEQDSTIIFNQH